MIDDTAHKEIVLTEQQESAVQQALSYLKEASSAGTTQRIFKIGGYAGTGKTTILRELKDRAFSQHFMNAAVCAFTGKATAVLRNKGVHSAKTIHSTIYHLDGEEAADSEKGEGTPKFVLKDVEEIHADFFIIDEASMVSASLLDGLMSFGLPIVAVGDPGQLEPVGDDVSLMKDCDVVLSEIHRQAEDNPIIHLANRVRKGEGFSETSSDDGCVEFVRDIKADWPDVILCGFNKTRHIVNFQVRKQLGYSADGKALVVGERLIVLQNNRKLSIFNGQMLEVLEIRGSTHVAGEDDPCFVTLKVKDEDPNRGPFVITAPLGYMGRDPDRSEKQLCRNRGYALVDYGYCVTVHKSQGSEWENVLVLDEQWSKAWTAERWRYTAFTRASKNLKIRMRGLR